MLVVAWVAGDFLVETTCETTVLDPDAWASLIVAQVGPFR